MPSPPGEPMIKLLNPQEAAAVLDVSVEVLARMIREGGYAYVETGPKPHRPPGVGRGRPTWRLTEEQLEEIVKGQTRCVAKPGEDAQHSTPSASVAFGDLWDGKRRRRTRFAV